MPAQWLYRSFWFQLARIYATQRADQDHWRILSAKHGLVTPYRLIEPYDLSLADTSLQSRKEWAEMVAHDLIEILEPQETVTILAGTLYRRNLTPLLLKANHPVDIPMKGLAIGKQLQWLKRNT